MSETTTPQIVPVQLDPADYWRMRHALEAAQRAELQAAITVAKARERVRETVADIRTREPRFVEAASYQYDDAACTLTPQGDPQP